MRGAFQVSLINSPQTLWMKEPRSKHLGVFQRLMNSSNRFWTLDTLVSPLTMGTSASSDTERWRRSWDYEGGPALLIFFISAHRFCFWFLISKQEMTSFRWLQPPRLWSLVSVPRATRAGKKVMLKWKGIWSGCRWPQPLMAEFSLLTCVSVCSEGKGSLVQGHSIRSAFPKQPSNWVMGNCTKSQFDYKSDILFGLLIIISTFSGTQ